MPEWARQQGEERTSKERIGDTEQRRIGVCPRKSSVFFSRRIARTDQGDVKLRYAVHNFGLHTTSNLLSMMWKCGPWMTPPPCPCDERFGSACCDPGRPQLSNAAHARTRRSLARAASSIRIPSFAPSLACSFVRSYVASLRARLPASLSLTHGLFDGPGKRQHNGTNSLALPPSPLFPSSVVAHAVFHSERAANKRD